MVAPGSEAARQFSTRLDDWMARLDSVLTRDSNGHHGVSVGDADGDGLEDLYVAPEHRGSGLGRDLLAALARICIERGYQRLEWWVLDWNPARGFYETLGARALTEWIPYRVDGEALVRLAEPR